MHAFKPIKKNRQVNIIVRLDSMHAGNLIPSSHTKSTHTHISSLLTATHSLIDTYIYYNVYNITQLYKHKIYITAIFMQTHIQ